MNIGRPKRVIEIDPGTLPVPETLPDPVAPSEPRPVEPVPADPVPAEPPPAPSR
ncbi:MAG: hypothetical protein WD739_01300 [Actinomycetota bacterium]